MNLQKNIIRRYKETYPQDKLKDISKKTSIQITRVFRLLNGAEMKVSELEAFMKTLAQSSEQTPLVKLAQECELELSKERKLFVITQLKHALKINQFKKTLDSQTFLFNSPEVQVG